jgi:hypothetical protein
VIPKGEQERRKKRERERRRKYCCVVKIDGIRQRINDLNYNAFCDSKLSNFREDNLIAVIARLSIIFHPSPFPLFLLMFFPSLQSHHHPLLLLRTSLFFTLNRQRKLVFTSREREFYDLVPVFIAALTLCRCSLPCVLLSCNHQHFSGP